MRYQDFILQFGEGPGGGYTVHVESPAGQGAGSFELPNVLERRVLRNVSSRVAVSAPPPLSPRELGAHLFETLFRGEVRQLFDQSWGQVKGEADRGLRLQVRLYPRHASTFELAEVPWELLYRSDTEQFLALSRKTPVSRHLIVPHAARPPIAPSPLRILAVLSNPEVTVPLALERERRELEAALSAANTVEVDVRPLTTAAELRQTLLREGYPVLHFMGHGEYTPGQGEGWLIFEDEDGGVDPVPGRHLADDLRDCASLQLVLLNACSTGRFDGRTGQPFAGVAAALVMAGVPAVVAMREPITDQGAIAFSSHLYRHLAEGDPLDAAVTEGRLAIQRQDRAGSEWSIPVLFQYQGSPSAGSVREAVPSGSSPVLPPEAGARDHHDAPGDSPRALRRVAGPVSATALVLLLAVLLAGLLARTNGWWPFAVTEDSAANGDHGREEGGDSPRQAAAREGAPGEKAGPGPQPSPADPRQLQTPPYRERQVHLYLWTPATTVVDTSAWRPQAERVFSGELASLGLQMSTTTHSEWLVVLELSRPALSSQRVDGRDNQVCQLRADYEFLHERNPQGESRSLTARAGQLTADRACETAVQRLAEQVGQEFLAVYLGE